MATAVSSAVDLTVDVVAGTVDAAVSLVDGGPHAPACPPDDDATSDDC